MPSVDRIIEQNDQEVGSGTSRFAPRFSYAASAFENGKYNVTGLSYPEDLVSNQAYGTNKVIFYINVNADSRVLKQGSNVGVVEGVQRDMRGDLVGQKYSEGAATAGAAGKAALLGGAAGAAAGVQGGTTGRGKVIGGGVKALGGALAGGALPTAAAQVVAAPPAAVEYLRANPAMKAAFDIKYGAGAADRALKGQ
jgi:hypothetical protein